MAPSPRTAAFVAALAAPLIPDMARGEDVDFDQFILQYGRTYGRGSDEYEERKALFGVHQRRAEEHNQRSDRTWTAGVTSLADLRPLELGALRGYRRTAGAGPQATAARARRGVALLGVSTRMANATLLPSELSWRGSLEALDSVMTQGQCGSCWAVVAAALLQAHSELFHKPRTFSVEQLVSCTPNPQHCGGDGGCGGATVGLALEYASAAGLADARAWPYRDTGAHACPSNKVMNGAAKLERRGQLFNMQGWRKLEENSLEAVMTALVTQGPVGVALGATEDWNLYKGGILSSCAKDIVINHAVMVVGYGSAVVNKQSMRYWEIQNSWGDQWGERGFLRLELHASEDEASWCGWDANPKEGSGCDGGPEKVWVCGSCGILYDVVVPEMKASEAGLWAQAGQGANASSVVAMQQSRRPAAAPVQGRGAGGLVLAAKRAANRLWTSTWTRQPALRQGAGKADLAAIRERQRRLSLQRPGPRYM